MIYLLLICTKNGYRVHSIHSDATTVEQWRKCKERDGEDTSIATIDANDVEDFRIELNDIIERKKAK